MGKMNNLYALANMPVVPLFVGIQEIDRNMLGIAYAFFPSHRSRSLCPSLSCSLFASLTINMEKLIEKV